MNKSKLPTGKELEWNLIFSVLASESQIERTALALEANNIHVNVVKNGAEAKGYRLK